MENSDSMDPLMGVSKATLEDAHICQTYLIRILIMSRLANSASRIIHCPRDLD
jgi:hypothetical protein